MDERYDSAFSGAQHDEAVTRVLGGELDELASSAAAAAARAAAAAEQAELAGYGLGAPSVSLITLPATATPSASVSATGSDNLKSFHFTFRLPVGTGVGSFNGRVGAVLPQAGDYTPEMVGAGRVNPNLLHNWFFVNSVNQRAKESYTGAVYGPDRWKGGTNASAFSARADGLHLTGGYILQRLEQPERLTGREFTYSVLVDANSAASVSSIRYRANGTGTVVANIPKGETGLFTGRFTAPAGLEGVTVVLGGSGELLLRAIKLEAGPAQTLARQDEGGNWVLNEFPDYGDQLLKCQRYYQLFSSDAARPAAAVDYRPTLRAEPEMGTITIDGMTYYSASAEL